MVLKCLSSLVQQWGFQQVALSCCTIQHTIQLHTCCVTVGTVMTFYLQGAYNSGKHGNLREFVNSGKFRENSGNLKFTQGIYQMLLTVIWYVSLGHRVVCIIVSNSSVNWLGDSEWRGWSQSPCSFNKIFCNSARKLSNRLLRWFVTSGFHFIIVWKRLFRGSGKPGILFCQICKHPDLDSAAIMDCNPRSFFACIWDWGICKPAEITDGRHVSTYTEKLLILIAAPL